MAHSVKHKTNSGSEEPNQMADASIELMQSFAKQMAKHSENMFNMDSFMNPAAAMSALNSNQMPVNNDGFSFNDQLSAQIQTLCLAQLATLYQSNPMMYQHLYPLLGAIEQLKQDPAQRMGFPQATNPLSMNNTFGAFDLTKMTPGNGNKKSAGKSQRQNQKLTNNKNDSVKSAKSMNHSTIAETATTNRNVGNFKIFKDEPIPKGYLKFRFNEDCNFPNCGYSNLQSHFHCCRVDCHYSFCDKTRFVQHTARHERLDKLMGDDFKQYRANMSCGHDDCVYKNNLGKFMQ